MLNINELERQWLAYKKRTLKPYLIGGLALLLVLIAAITYGTFSRNDVVKSTPKQPVKTVQQPAVYKPVTVNKEPIPAPVQVPKQDHSEQSQTTTKATIPLKKQAKVKKREIKTAKKEPQELMPSFAFIDTIKPTKPKPKKTVKKKKVPKPKKKKTQKRSPIPVPKSTLTTEATDDKILSLRKRFERTKNPTLGTVITRLYYEKKAYSLAYKYALEVNAIDETNIHSWLYAAKSLYFLGQKDKAVNMLQQYIQKTHSSSAQKLLNEIRSGTLK